MIPTICFQGSMTWPRINAHTTPAGITLSTNIHGQPLSKTFKPLGRADWESFIQQAKELQEKIETTKQLSIWH